MSSSPQPQARTPKRRWKPIWRSGGYLRLLRFRGGGGRESSHAFDPLKYPLPNQKSNGTHRPRYARVGFDMRKNYDYSDGPESLMGLPQSWFDCEREFWEDPDVNSKPKLPLSEKGRKGDPGADRWWNYTSHIRQNIGIWTPILRIMDKEANVSKNEIAKRVSRHRRKLERDGILATEYRDLGYWNLESQLDRLTLETLQGELEYDGYGSYVAEPEAGPSGEDVGRWKAFQDTKMGRTKLVVETYSLDSDDPLLYEEYEEVLEEKTREWEMAKEKGDFEMARSIEPQIDLLNQLLNNTYIGPKPKSKHLKMRWVDANEAEAHNLRAMESRGDTHDNMEMKPWLIASEISEEELERVLSSNQSIVLPVDDQGESAFAMPYEGLGASKQGEPEGGDKLKSHFESRGSSGTAPTDQFTLPANMTKEELDLHFTQLFVSPGGDRFGRHDPPSTSDYHLPKGVRWPEEEERELSIMRGMNEREYVQNLRMQEKQGFRNFSEIVNFHKSAMRNLSEMTYVGLDGTSDTEERNAGIGASRKDWEGYDPRYSKHLQRLARLKTRPKAMLGDQILRPDGRNTVNYRHDPVELARFEARQRQELIPRGRIPAGITQQDINWARYILGIERHPDKPQDDVITLTEKREWDEREKREADRLARKILRPHRKINLITGQIEETHPSDRLPYYISRVTNFTELFSRFWIDGKRPEYNEWTTDGFPKLRYKKSDSEFWDNPLKYTDLQYPDTEDIPSDQSDGLPGPFFHKKLFDNSTKSLRSLERINLINRAVLDHMLGRENYTKELDLSFAPKVEQYEKLLEKGMEDFINTKARPIFPHEVIPWLRKLHEKEDTQTKKPTPQGAPGSKDGDSDADTTGGADVDADEDESARIESPDQSGESEIEPMLADEPEPGTDSGLNGEKRRREVALGCRDSFSDFSDSQLSNLEEPEKSMNNQDHRESQRLKDYNEISPGGKTDSDTDAPGLTEPKIKRTKMKTGYERDGELDSQDDESDPDTDELRREVSGIAREVIHEDQERRARADDHGSNESAVGPESSFVETEPDD